VENSSRHHQPHLVPVPDGPDGIDGDATLDIVLPDERVQHPDAEVESLQNEEPHPEDGDDHIPDVVEIDHFVS
jgi:hypothetical protein